jgi:putative transposase
MPKRKNYQLTRKEAQAIDKAINHAPEAEVRQRAMGLKLLHLGHAAWEVAEMMAVDVVSIYNWHKRWEAEGLAGLANRPRSGRPSKADQGYVELLGRVIEQDPAELGYGFSFWTAGRLLRHLEKETGIGLSPNRFRALLKGCGYVYRQPTHDLSGLQDPLARKAAGELVDWLKKRPVSTRPSSCSLWTKPP